ncbi:MAG: MipA/OmpV family protein [Pseudorhodobacter sp.]
MKKFLAALAFAALPGTVFADDLQIPVTSATDPAMTTVSRQQASRPALVFRLRGGVSYTPEYFGSRHNEIGPDFSMNADFLRLPGGYEFGSPDPDRPNYGFSPRGSFRYISKRDSSDHAELTGMEDVKASFEIGLGLGYSQRNFEAWGDIRYGAIGHHSWVGELGSNLVLRPTQQLTLRVGPRVFFGDGDYANTYFGVSAAESLASGLAAHNPGGGALTAGVELGATYAINDDWGIDGAVRYDRYLNDAKSSPIVQQGSDDSWSLRIGVTRRISLNF